MFGTQNSSSKGRFPINGWLLFGLLGLIVVVLVFGQNSMWLSPSSTNQTPAQPEADSPAETDASVADTASVTADASTNTLDEITEAEEPFLPDYDSAFDSALAPEADNRPFWQVALDLGVKLLIVIGLAYASMAGLRWLQKTKRLPKAGSETIQILETVGLAPGKTLHLVVVGEKTLLLGATDQQLSLLSELDPVSAPNPVTKEMLYEEGAAENAVEVDQDAPATPFEVALYQQTMTQQSQQSPAQNETSATPGEWQSVLESMKTGVRHIQDVVGGGQSR